MTQHKPVRAVQGRGQGQAKVFDEHDSPTPNFGFVDTDIQMSPPHESAEVSTSLQDQFT
jgi:hypothetical protein